MKKLFCLTAFVILSVSAQIMAQSKPFMGYDKVEWGTSVVDVKKAYQFPDNAELKVSEDDQNIFYLTQENVSSSIKSRFFAFINDKLYVVVVFYSDVSDNNSNNLESALETRYGVATDRNTKTEEKSIMFQTLYAETETVLFGKYDPSLHVEMTHIVFRAENMERDTNNLLQQNQLYVRYIWKKFKDEYNATKLGL